jgi:hypothetical protein
MKAYQIVKDLWEASYPENIGFVEMTQFFKKATNAQKKEMEKLCKAGDWDAYKALIKKVVGVQLQ